MVDKIESELSLKMVLVGDSGVGKSNIILRATKNEFQLDLKTTIGVEFATKNFEVCGRTVKAQIWDTAGQERYRSMASAYYRGAHGALIVYDVTRGNSFENIEKWLKEIRAYASESFVCLLIGNKADLKQFRALKYEHGEEFAKKHGMAFLETSALENTNINEAFNQILEEILQRNEFENKPQRDQVGNTVVKKEPIYLLKKEYKKKCC